MTKPPVKSTGGFSTPRNLADPRSLNSIVTVCQEVVEGCPDCEAEATFKGDHQCGDLCEVWGESKRNSAQFHRLSHEPHLCESCGFTLNSKRSEPTVETRLCKAGYCTEWYCPSCGAKDGSAGTVGCPSCGSWGHVTRKRISRMHRQYARRR